MKYMIEYTIRNTGLTYEQNFAGAEALLTAFSKWKPEDGLSIHAFVSNVSGTGGYVLVEAGALTRLEHLNFTSICLRWRSDEIQVGVALRLGRPRRFRGDLDGAGGGERAWRARGGRATWAHLKSLDTSGAASVRTSQSAAR